MPTLKQVDLELEPAVVDEWEDEDAVAGVLGADTRLADDDQVRAMLSEVRLTLPAALTTQELVSYARDRATPLDEVLRPDLERFDYYLVQMPLNVIVPAPKHLVRLRLKLKLEADGSDPVVAYDVFPGDKWSVKDHDLGSLSIDVSKALTFVCPAPIADVLGLKLEVPLHWQTKTAQISASDRNANPAEWYVADEEIGDAFTPYLIVRASKDAAVKISAELAGELRYGGALGWLKGRFRSKDDRVFAL